MLPHAFLYVCLKILHKSTHRKCWACTSCRGIIMQLFVLTPYFCCGCTGTKGVAVSFCLVQISSVVLCVFVLEPLFHLFFFLKKHQKLACDKLICWCLQVSQQWPERTTAWMPQRTATWTTCAKSTARPTSAPAPAESPPQKSATRGSATRPWGSSLTRQGVFYPPKHAKTKVFQSDWNLIKTISTQETERICFRIHSFQICSFCLFYLVKCHQKICNYSTAPATSL